MHRVDAPGATVANLFTNGDPTNAIVATRLEEDWHNAVQEELCNAITTGTGITLVKGTWTQLLAAIRYHVLNPTGTVNVFSKLLFPDGTAAAPSVSFTSDTDTGLYRIGANELGVAANGALVARFGSYGIKALRPTIHVQDQKTAGTAGGTFTSGADRTRDLTTVVSNTITGASLASNKITLPAGTFRVTAHSSAYSVDGHRIILYNVTDAVTVTNCIGTEEFAAAGASQTKSTLNGVIFTIAASKDFEIRHRSAVTQATNGFGTGASLGTVNIFTDVQIERLGD